jgi:hypothetical protein
MSSASALLSSALMSSADPAAVDACVMSRSSANETVLAIADAVGDVYSQVGLRADESAGAAATATEGDEDDESTAASAGGSASKKARRSSGAGATDKAIEGFATVMSAFLPQRPPPPPEKLTWKQWALQCMLTDDQKAAVLSCLPDPSMEPQPSLLAFLDPVDDLEKICKLKKAQLGCWGQLASSMRKQ